MMSFEVSRFVQNDHRNLLSRQFVQQAIRKKQCPQRCDESGDHGIELAVLGIPPNDSGSSGTRCPHQVSNPVLIALVHWHRFE